MPPLHHLHHAPVHQVGRREVFDAVAAQLDAALGDLTALGLEQVGDGAQRGRLARAVATQYGSDLALGHVERNALQHQDHMVVDDLDAVDVENDIAVGVHGVAFLYQSKELLHNPLDWRLPKRQPLFTGP
ncbi:hypothetical protein D3C72_1889300 [compost metagenome]